MRQLTSVALAIAAAFAMASAAQAATQTISTASYTLSYEDSTDFGSLAFTSGTLGSEGFGWRPSNNVGITVLGGTSAGTTTLFNLPSFTLTANSGYTFNGPLQAFLGNLSYTIVNDGHVAGRVDGSVSVNGGASTLVSQNLDYDIRSAYSGYMGASANVPYGSFTSLQFTGGLLSLTGYGSSPMSVAIISADSKQNELSFSFGVTPVPEPETYAMMLAGLGAVGFMARRRKAA